MLKLDLKYILVIEVDRDIREIIGRSLGKTANWQVLSTNSIAQGFTLSCLFCLVATTDLGFDPIDNFIFFVGGAIAIGWVTLATLNIFEN